MPHHQSQFTYQEVAKHALPADAQALLAAAEKAAGGAYAPYSGFRVGAAVQLETGEILTAANHENAAYPVGVCAEQIVLGRLDMNGPKVLAIAVTYQTERPMQHAPLSPCGLCRQSLLEVRVHQGAPIVVYMASPDELVRVVPDARDLLPLHFSSENL